MADFIEIEEQIFRKDLIFRISKKLKSILIEFTDGQIIEIGTHNVQYTYDYIIKELL